MQKTKKILFLLYSPLFTKGGHSKNFLNLIKFLEPHFNVNNYKVIICSLNNKNKDLKKNKLKITETNYFRKAKIIMLKRTFPSGNAIYQLLEFAINLSKLLVLFIKNKPHLVYAYSDKTLYLSAVWKTLFNYKLVSDLRGDTISERLTKGYSLLKIKVLKIWDKYCENKSDLIFHVSAALVDKKNSNKFVAKYNYYDSKMFHYNKIQSILKKKKLGLNDKFVFIYTGGINYYQMLEETIYFFSEFNNRHKDSFFIIISEYNSIEFEKYLIKYNVPSIHYSIYNLDQVNINEIQTIADLAFLLRDDINLNHHAFPTKYAEYLASGVPIISTPHIHTIAPMILENNLGEIIKTIKLNQNYNDIIDKIYNKYKNNHNIKNRCASFAQKELMWQNKARNIFQIIDKLNEKSF